MRSKLTQLFSAVLLLLIALLLCILFAASRPSQAQTQPYVRVDSIIFLRVPNKPDGKPGIHYEPFMYHFGDSAHIPGAHIMRLSPPTPNGTLTDLTEDFFAAEEPEISWDAQKIIFAGKKTAQDKWEVWEMNADGSGKRQITKGGWDVCSPCYLPDGRILFSSLKHAAMNPERHRDEYDRDFARLAHRCNADGSNVEQITFNVSSDSEFVVMRDGRILFQSWQHHGIRHHASGASALFTMNPDGTGFLDLYGNHRGNFRWKQREMPDGKIICVESVFHTAFGGGWLGLFTPEDPEGTIQNLTPEVNVYSPNSPGGRYRDPYPVPDGRLIVAWSPPPAWGDTPQGPQVQFGLYWFDFEKKKVGDPIYNDPKYQALNPIPLVPQVKPKIIPDHGIEREKKTGTLLCLNAYEGQLDKEAFIKPGQIKKVRIIEGFGIHDADPFFRSFPPGIGYSSFGSSSNSISNFEQKRVVGEAPVEADGSFYVEVPADTILHWQTLDENGMALQDALTWAWVRPGEHRVCVGCHEDRKRTPPIKSVPLAARTPPVVLNPPPDQRMTVDFRRDLMPIIERKCVRCHSGANAAAGLDLGGGMELVYQRVVEDPSYAYHINAALFNRAYLSLSASANFVWGKFIYPGLARRSPLIWRLYGYSPRFDVKVNQCPPDQPLTDEEKKLFALWVDLGAQWDNLPGPDPYKSYSAEESGKIGKPIHEKIAKVISDPREAAETRCIQCHPLYRTLTARKTPEQWKETVQKMCGKAGGWIKTEEIEPIARYISEVTNNAGFIRKWMVIGPFEDNNFVGVKTAYPPEKEIDFAKTYQGKGGKPVKWQEVNLTDGLGTLNFESVFGGVDRAVAYAYTVVNSSEEKDVQLRIGADEMFTVWVNGKKALERLIEQPAWLDWDKVNIRLKKGENTLLVKAHDLYGGWEMRARLTQVSDAPMVQAAAFETPKVVSAPSKRTVLRK